MEIKIALVCTHLMGTGIVTVWQQDWQVWHSVAITAMDTVVVGRSGHNVALATVIAMHERIA